MGTRNKSIPFSHKQRVARLRGQADFERGKSVSDNPYSMEKLRFAWHDAYTAAMRTTENNDAEYSREQARSAELARRGATNW